MESHGAGAAHSEAACPKCHFDLQSSQHHIRGPPAALYSHLLRVNLCPSQELSTLKAGLFEAKAQLSLVSDTINRLQATLVALEAEKRRIEGVVRKYRSIMRPVHTLPIEILARIFSVASKQSAVPYDSVGLVTGPPSSLIPSRPPWILSQVCRSWRQLALDTSSLWSFVSFNFLAGRTSVLHAQCHRLQLQLRRAANRPLDIITTTSTSDSTTIHRLLFPLCSSSPNWRRLCIELNDAVFLPVLTSISGRLQGLESLDLHLIAPITHDIDCFQFAPRLVRLSLSGGRRLGSTIGNRHSIKLPYHQITRYCWQDDDSDNFHDMNPNADSLGSFPLAQFTLRKMSHLRFCCLYLHSRGNLSQYKRQQSAQGFTGGSLKVSFHHLVGLELHAIDMQTGIHEVLPWIVNAPSLEKLTIFSSGPDRASLSAFLTHPQRLTSLLIPMVEMPPDEFSAVLSRLVALKDLSFGVAGGITDGHISLFLPTRPGTSDFSIVPKLENLTLLAIPDTQSSYSEDTLLDMLEARWWAPPPASGLAPGCCRLLSVNLDKPVESEAGRQFLDWLRVEGLRVGIP
ncbi:hypothetical protein V5O48_017559 [Marasmius crinis-equi]|uniref:F-box domain-containing protein n=1 Tax=Marasmius crinis-equi TaxID=585013 RepID=A0ABR3ENP4_9AGAR